MTGKIKLTVAQADLLCRVAEDGGKYHCSDTYRPAQKLVALGLCEGNFGKFGSYTIILTQAGRDHMETRK